MSKIPLIGKICTIVGKIFTIVENIILGKDLVTIFKKN
jgi:hypothetical protein